MTLLIQGQEVDVGLTRHSVVLPHCLLLELSLTKLEHLSFVFGIELVPMVDKVFQEGILLRFPLVLLHRLGRLNFEDAGILCRLFFTQHIFGPLLSHHDIFIVLPTAVGEVGRTLFSDTVNHREKLATVIFLLH